nr:Chain C, ATP-Peptide Conjugate [synthetic construct]
EAIFAAPFAKK